MEGWWRYCAEGLLWVCGRSAFCWQSFRMLGWVMCRYSVSWLIGIADGLKQKCRPSAVDRPGLLFSRTYKPYLVGLGLVLFCSAWPCFVLFCSVLPGLALLCLVFSLLLLLLLLLLYLGMLWYALVCSALVWPGLLCFVCLDSSFSFLSCFLYCSLRGHGVVLGAVCFGVVRYWDNLHLGDSRFGHGLVLGLFWSWHGRYLSGH